MVTLSKFPLPDYLFGDLLSFEVLYILFKIGDYTDKVILFLQSMKIIGIGHLNCHSGYFC